MSKALEDIAEERRRQISQYGFHEAHDDAYSKGELVSASINYAAAAVMASKLGLKRWEHSTPPHEATAIAWPWMRQWWRPGGVRRMLVKAGALIVAEIERIDRAEENGQ